MDKENSDDSNTLIFKNIPKQIDNLAQLLQSLQIPPTRIKTFGRKRALIAYESKSQTDNALDIIRELEFGGKAPNISLFCKDKVNKDSENDKTNARTKSHKSKGVQTCKEKTVCPTTELQVVNKYVQKLYATEEDLSFDQTPPPYLKYQYPPVNKDILDNICISLFNNKKFYTQVLHLMNRMNLEPPFRERKQKFRPKLELKEAFTQTEEVVIEQCTGKEDSESELESSDDMNESKQSQIIPKRKLPPSEDQYKKKARQMLQTMHKLTKDSTPKNASSKTALRKVFDPPTSKFQSSKIELHITRPMSAKPTADLTSETSKTITNISTSAHECTIDFPMDLASQKIGVKEMQELTVFTNYRKGEPSNKLYIKNLQKDVVTADLHALYRRFILDDTRIRLDIKVMQHGRMKGQAFVSFIHTDADADLQHIVSQALEYTNGFILRDKPMVVCFGKQS